MIPNDQGSLSALLAREGFLAAEEESEQLLSFAGGDRDLLASAVRRRLTGEPLAWITGRVRFCDIEIHVDRDVYVPRWISEPLVRAAVGRLPDGGAAIDLCTGSGAIARVVRRHRPRARVVASDIDAHAVACAAVNGVEVYRGDLFAPLPAELEGRVDLVVGVVPYVPTAELALLQRDTFTFETPLSYDGGTDGTDILRRVIREAPRFLRPEGALLLEIGGDQAGMLSDELRKIGYVDLTVHTDEDGDVRAIEANSRPASCTIQRFPSGSLKLRKELKSVRIGSGPES